MGNMCKGDSNINDENDNEEEMDDLQDWGHEKVSLPNPAIAYNINSLPPDEKSEGKLTNLQQQINSMKAHEKKGKKQMNITRSQGEGGALASPFTIRSMDAIYIGQWKYNTVLQSSVPGGIGRLYTQNEIMEGQVLTTFDDNQRFKGDIHDNIIDTMVRENKKRAKFFNVTEQGFSGSLGSKQVIKIDIKLQGYGRIFSRTKDYNGFFKGGVLDGKGEIQQKYGNDIYHYKGEFIKGLKDGKGIQKFKGTLYEGQFSKDKKHGKGSLTLFISHKFQKQEEDQNVKVQQDIGDKLPSYFIKGVMRFLQKRKQILDEKVDEALKEFPWKGPEIPATYNRVDPKHKKQPYPQTMFIYNDDFILQHLRKTKYPEQYRGDFVQNQFTGVGRYTWFNGKVYQGQWKDGQMHGFGQFYWHKGGYYYIGQYKNDKKHGKGTIYWSLTKRYRGQWYQGYRHGYGELISIEKCSDTKNVPVVNNQKQENNVFGAINQAMVDGMSKFTHLSTQKSVMIIIGALFNKDKIHQALWQKQKELVCNLQQLYEYQYIMACRAKRIRINQPMVHLDHQKIDEDDSKDK